MATVMNYPNIVGTPYDYGKKKTGWYFRVSENLKHRIDNYMDLRR